MTALSKTEVAVLRKQLRELRLFKHNIDHLIDPLLKDIWLDGYNSENSTFEQFRERYLSAKKKAAEEALKRHFLSVGV